MIKVAAVLALLPLAALAATTAEKAAAVHNAILAVCIDASREKDWGLMMRRSIA